MLSRMGPTIERLIVLFLFSLLSGVAGLSATAAQITQLTPAKLWQRLEFGIDNVLTASNPFDPDIIRLDATFTLPSGATMVVPAFWYQGYTRTLSGGSEVIAPAGLAQWRLRFTPTQAGSYSLSLNIRTNSQLSGAPLMTNFTVSTIPAPAGFGYVRVAASKQYLETGDGQALRLIGQNVCWPSARGTYDYETYFGAMQSAGENYARIWMCPWSFGIETDVNSLTHYRLDRAWQLDYVLQLSEQRGIYLLLCLDFHGMFEVKPDYFGGNNFWPSNPYNVTNGGPCLNQNGFFTNTTARTLYQKRLRYLIARYGYSPNLLAWQLMNEIDNEYAYLNPADVAAWHGVMGAWLHSNDPFGRLVTTSLTGSSDRPEIWSLPQMDFSDYHSYSEPSIAMRLTSVTQSFLQRYRKPVLIDEFGTDWRGWNRSNDPYLRGFRQGLWGGALGGSVGGGMSWWWESIQAEGDYPVYSALGSILNKSGWGRGAWSSIAFKTAGPPPNTVSHLITGGQPFNAFLSLNSAWGSVASGQLAIANPAAAGYSATTFDSFVHGQAHPELRAPFRLSAWLTNNARLVMHLNSVSDGSILVVRANGTELFRTNLVNLDGGYSVNEEYNTDVIVNLPSGKRLLEITNAGLDWFNLDWVRLEQVLPSTYPGNWAPSPDAIGLRGASESLLYLVAPGVSFPAGATNATLPLQHAQTVTLSNWPSANYFAEWYDPATATPLGLTQGATTNGLLVLPLPDVSEDLAAIVFQPPRLTALRFPSSNTFQLRLDSEIGGQYLIQSSSNLAAWGPWIDTNSATGPAVITGPGQTTNGNSFFRAKRVQ